MLHWKLSCFKGVLKSNDGKNFQKKKKTVQKPRSVTTRMPSQVTNNRLTAKLSKKFGLQKSFRKYLFFSVEKGNWYVPIFSAVLQVLLEISKINLDFLLFTSIVTVLINRKSIFFLSKYNIYCKRIWKILVCTFL